MRSPRSVVIGALVWTAVLVLVAEGDWLRRAQAFIRSAVTPKRRAAPATPGSSGRSGFGPGVGAGSGAGGGGGGSW